MKQPGISVIIPTYNEADNIGSTLQAVITTCRRHHLTYEICVIDDHSLDATRSIVKKYSATYPVSLHLKKTRRGRGYSIVEALDHVSYPYLAILDADDQVGAGYLPRFLQAAQIAGIAYASRGSSRLSNFLHLPNYKGLKVLKADILHHLDKRLVSRWVIDMPLVHTARLLGYTGQIMSDMTPHTQKERSVTKRLWRHLELAVGNAIARVTRPIFQIGATTKHTMLGAGVIFRRQHFITHTTLPKELSAIETFSSWQSLAILMFIALFGVGISFAAQTTAIIAIGILSFIYLVDVIFNLTVLLKSLHTPPELTLDQHELETLSDSELPTYSILCPLYKEARVLPQFVAAMTALDYPVDKLDIMLLLEADDKATIAAAEAMQLPPSFRLVIVPDSQPKTKPKACNYGLGLAKGEYIVIYDAEDQPDPLQLKKAYLGFSKSAPNVACLQAKLNYYNPAHNLLTRLFTAEYSLWFDIMLPGFQSIHTTIPLGGTSNHFKTSVLKSLHGWDPFNVTEDADLGARLFNAGYQTAIIDSTTLEEANSSWRNWFRQRSRWIKGYMQTYLVHMRRPLEHFRKLGLHAFIFQLVVGGRISFMLINPLLWAMTIAYFVLYRQVGAAIESIYPGPVFYMAVTSLVIGNFVYLYNYMIGCVKRGHFNLVKYVFLVPIYWLMISVSAGIALFQLFFKPHYWEKTIHGLHLDRADRQATRESARALRKKRLKEARAVQRLADLAVSVFHAGGAMVLASLVTNFLNFLYNSYLGRTLSYADFGEISLFASFLYIASVLFSGYGRTMTHTSAYLLGKYGAPIKAVWFQNRAQAARVAFGITLGWLLCAPLLAHFFHVDSLMPFILFAPVWMFGTLGAVDSGFLGGSLLFGWLSVISVLESLAKIVAAVGLITLGMHQYVYSALAISMGLSMFLSWATVRRVHKKNEPVVTPTELKLSRKFFLAATLNSLASLTYLSLDVMLVKHFLPPEIAGAYAYLALAGKMVFFMGGMFSQFVLPYVSRDAGAGKSGLGTFKRLVLLVLAANLGSFLIFGIFGFVTAPLLWGGQVSAIIKYLPVYALAMVLFSLSSLVVTYHHARRHYLFPLASFAIGLMQLFAMAIYHHSIHQLVVVMTLFAGINLVTVALLHHYYEAVHIIYRNLVDLVDLVKPLPSPPALPRDKHAILIFNWRDLRHKWAGGAEVYIHELARRWVAAGHQVTVFSGNDGQSIRHEKIDGVRIIRRGGFYFYFVWAFLYYLLRLRGKYDIVIDSENGLPFFTPLYVKERKYLLIHHVHQEVFRKSLHPPFSWLAAFLERRVMPIVYANTKVITVSPSSRDDILIHHLTTMEPLIVYNGVDLKTYKPSAKAKVPTVLYLGRLTSAKSIHVLIQSIATLRKHVPRLKVVIAGDGPHRGTLERLTKSLGLTQMIRFVGKVSEKEKIRLYQRAWVFVNPSLIEGWGITTIEANACGTPVIASNVPGLRDAVQDKNSGLLVPYGNVKLTAEAILAVLTDARLRHKLERGALQWAHRFDWDRSAEKALKIIGEGI